MRQAASRRPSPSQGDQRSNELLIGKPRRKKNTTTDSEKSGVQENRNRGSQDGCEVEMLIWYSMVPSGTPQTTDLSLSQQISSTLRLSLALLSVAARCHHNGRLWRLSPLFEACCYRLPPGCSLGGNEAIFNSGRSDGGSPNKSTGKLSGLQTSRDVGKHDGYIQLLKYIPTDSSSRFAPTL